MNKIFIVASSEFTTLTRSKAFVLGLFLMPVFVGGAILMQGATKDQTDTKDRPFAVVDRTGLLYATLKTAADDWNGTTGGLDGARVAPRLLPSEVPSRDGGPGADDQLRMTLSDRVRRAEIFAFVEIPANAFDPASSDTLRYYSNHPADRVLPDWLMSTLNREIINERFHAAAIDRGVVAKLTRPRRVEQLGLVSREANGAVKAATRVDEVRVLAVPAVLMMLMFFAVMTTSPQLLNSTIEEKMNRVSEVLIGSVTPFQLMMGKLLGSASVSLLLACVYLAGGLGAARYWGYGDAVTPATLAWFLLFLSMAVLIFGSLFIAIGAACSDLKDAQNMMTPAMLLVMVPMMTWLPVARAPEGTLAVTLSLIPTATPFLMLLRMALPPGPPVWQVALGVGLTMATVVAAIYAAGKIFRTGLLMQGKAATLGEMWRWVRAD
jgi:ABC-2 type transport system permease protein